MQFEQFEEIMKAILCLDEEIRGLSCALKNYFDGHVICTIGNQSIPRIIEALEYSVRGKSTAFGDISWWIYDTECGKERTTITYPDGTTKEIKTLRNLYDFIKEQAGDI